MKQSLTAGMLCFFLYFTFPFSVYSFYNESLTFGDPRSLSLGNVRALSRQLGNPASLSFREKPLIGITVHNRFEMKELNTGEGYILFPNAWLDTGMKIARFGYSDYELWSGTFGLSKKITPFFSLGCNMHYSYERISPDESRSVLQTDIGMYFRLSEKVEAGLLAENPLSNDPYTVFALRGGIGWQVYPSCLLLIEFFSDFNQQFNLSMGVEYELLEQWVLRAGFRTDPGTPTFGLAYSVRSYTVDFHYSNHYLLGNSTSLGVSFHF